MQIRPLQPGDIDKLRARSRKCYDKLNPPELAEEALVGVDESGEPRVIMVAEKVTEIFMVLDHEWQSPAMRLAAIEQLHKEMQARLRRKGYRVGYCFLADGVPNGYARRLVKLGWNMMERVLRFV